MVVVGLGGAHKSRSFIFIQIEAFALRVLKLVTAHNATVYKGSVAMSVRYSNKTASILSGVPRSELPARRKCNNLR